MPVFHIVNVGHGNSTVVEDNNGIVIIDAGPKTGLLEFLDSKGITSIAVVLLSHTDRDHIGGLLTLITSERFKIDRIYLNSDSIQGSDTWRDLAIALYDLSLRGKCRFETSLTVNQNGSLDQGDINIEILAPNVFVAAMAAGGRDINGNIISSNSISAVIRLKYFGQNIALLPGDIDEAALERMVHEKLKPEAPLVIFPHHGGKPGNNVSEKRIKSFTKKFCEMTKPNLIVFSISNNDNKFPRKEVIDTILSCNDNVRIISTSESGIISELISTQANSPHFNSVGHISLDFAFTPPRLLFENGDSLVLD